jgi:hypothetical protein
MHVPKIQLPNGAKHVRAKGQPNGREHAPRAGPPANEIKLHQNPCRGSIISRRVQVLPILGSKTYQLDR